jgi:response regulator of citrate/malate metabolism
MLAANLMWSSCRKGITFLRECHLAKSEAAKRKPETFEKMRPSPTLMLLSADEVLADLVSGMVQQPWKLVRQGANKDLSRKMFTQPHVRVVIFDDQVVEENDRNWLLAKIRRYFSGAVLLYVAGSQNDHNEKRARANGAQYYVSKPLWLEGFGHVLQSFLQAENAKGSPIHSAREISAMDGKESSVKDANRVDAGIRSLANELNSEDAQLRLFLLDAALAGLRLERNPESRELRCDAARIWATIEPILSHHLEAEDSELLPWLDRQGGLSQEGARKVRECHHRLRTLMGAIAQTDTDRLTDALTRDAGRALTGLAVYLDDAIDDEQRRLFPTIQRALSAPGRRV